MEHEETNGNGTRLSTKAKILDEIGKYNSVYSLSFHS
jgi:hypothetical protein